MPGDVLLDVAGVPGRVDAGYEARCEDRPALNPAHLPRQVMRAPLPRVLEGLAPRKRKHSRRGRGSDSPITDSIDQ